MTTALLLIRTPFQAWLAEKVLAAEGVDEYQIHYFTEHNAPEDQHYFSILKTHAQAASYYYTKSKPFDVLTHVIMAFKARKLRRDCREDLVILGSIDSFVISAAAGFQKQSRLITLDDGTGNYKINGIYHNENLSWRAKLYQYCLGSLPLQTIKSRIERHYTINPQLPNIVSAQRLMPLPRPASIHSISGNGIDELTIFLGAPFAEAWSARELAKLRHFLTSIRIDQYVRHPRERAPFVTEIPLLEKHGRIAEDALAELAERNPLHVIGVYSSALFNLSGIVAKRSSIHFLNESDVPSKSARQLATQAADSGCEIIWI